MFVDAQQVFETRSFKNIETTLEDKNVLFNLVSDKIKAQISRTRTEESSPKNTTLYFSILTESKDLVETIFEMLELYYVCLLYTSPSPRDRG